MERQWTHSWLSGRVSRGLSCVMCFWLPCGYLELPFSPWEKDLSLAGHGDSSLNRQVAPDYMRAAGKDRQYSVASLTTPMAQCTAAVSLPHLYDKTQP